MRPQATGKRILQIAYDGSMMYRRASLLQELGYEVRSVLGNDAARDVLAARPQYDLFIIGPSARHATRLEMAELIRASYPMHPIIALNPASSIELKELRYNAPANEPEIWIPLVQEAQPRAP